MRPMSRDITWRRMGDSNCSVPRPHRITDPRAARRRSRHGRQDRPVFHPTALTVLGVLVHDPSPAQARSSQRIRYALDRERVDERHAPLARSGPWARRGSGSAISRVVAGLARRKDRRPMSEHPSEEQLDGPCLTGFYGPTRYPPRANLGGRVASQARSQAVRTTWRAPEPIC